MTIRAKTKKTNTKRAESCKAIVYDQYFSHFFPLALFDSFVLFLLFLSFAHTTINHFYIRSFRFVYCVIRYSCHSPFLSLSVFVCFRPLCYSPFLFSLSNSKSRPFPQLYFQKRLQERKEKERMTIRAI